MIQLLVATYNQGKLVEFRDLLRCAAVHVIGPRDLGLELAIEESGGSYTSNARLKAEAFVRASGEMVLADDSGLEVDALNGEPGLHSARYAGATASDRDRYRLLLDKLSGLPWERRTARFRCVLALAIPAGDVRTVEGVCEGFIAHEPRGDHGFGYDPVFYLPGQDRTMAELDPRTKNEVSHRAMAVKALLPWLERYSAGCVGTPTPGTRAA